jgi:hypothetical protein
MRTPVRMVKTERHISARMSVAAFSMVETAVDSARYRGLVFDFGSHQRVRIARSSSAIFSSRMTSVSNVVMAQVQRVPPLPVNNYGRHRQTASL